MTAVKSVSAKPMSGFEKKKNIEINGGEFVKMPTLDDPKTLEWVCLFEGQEIGRARLQIDCVNAAVEELGGE